MKARLLFLTASLALALSAGAATNVPISALPAVTTPAAADALGHYWWSGSNFVARRITFDNLVNKPATNAAETVAARHATAATNNFRNGSGLTNVVAKAISDNGVSAANYNGSFEILIPGTGDFVRLTTNNAAQGLLLVPHVASGGTFTGDGSGLTNVPGTGSSGGPFYGDGAGITNVTSGGNLTNLQVSSLAQKSSLMQNLAWNVVDCLRTNKAGSQFIYEASPLFLPNGNVILVHGIWSNSFASGYIAGAAGPSLDNLSDIGALLEPTPGAWDSGYVSPGRIYQEGGTNYLFYFAATNENDFESGYCSIGVAYSVDGTNWTKNAANPILSPTTALFTNYVKNYVMSCVKVGGIYHGFFNGARSEPPNTRETICRAYATNIFGPWVAFTNAPILVNSNGASSVLADAVVFPLREGGWGMSFREWYTDKPFGSQPAFAWSYDLTNWFGGDASGNYSVTVRSLHPLVTIGPGGTQLNGGGYFEDAQGPGLIMDDLLHLYLLRPERQKNRELLIDTGSERRAYFSGDVIGGGFIGLWTGSNALTQSNTNYSWIANGRANILNFHGPVADSEFTIRYRDQVRQKVWPSGGITMGNTSMGLHTVDPGGSNLVVEGNITSQKGKFIGDGSLLSGISGALNTTNLVYDDTVVAGYVGAWTGTNGATRSNTNYAFLSDGHTQIWNFHQDDGISDLTWRYRDQVRLKLWPSGGFTMGNTTVGLHTVDPGGSNLVVEGNITSQKGKFIGDGSLLTGIAGSTSGFTNGPVELTANALENPNTWTSYLKFTHGEGANSTDSFDMLAVNTNDNSSGYLYFDSWWGEFIVAGTNGTRGLQITETNTLLRGNTAVTGTLTGDGSGLTNIGSIWIQPAAWNIAGTGGMSSLSLSVNGPAPAYAQNGAYCVGNSAALVHVPVPSWTTQATVRAFVQANLATDYYWTNQTSGYYNLTNSTGRVLPAATEHTLKGASTNMTEWNFTVTWPATNAVSKEIRINWLAGTNSSTRYMIGPLRCILQ